MKAKPVCSDEMIRPLEFTRGMPRVALVSGVAVHREGVAASLFHNGSLEVVAKTGVADAVKTVATCRPDAVLVDASVEEGLALARLLHIRFPAMPLIAFGILSNSSSFIACAEAGCSASVDRQGTIENLVAAVVSALRGELACTPRFASLLCRRLAVLANGRPKANDTLTPREQQVAALVAQGRSNKEIAADLQIGPSTVKNYVHNILEKLHVSRRAAIASRLDQVDHRRLSDHPGRASLNGFAATSSSTGGSSQHRIHEP